MFNAGDENDADLPPKKCRCRRDPSIHSSRTEKKVSQEMYSKMKGENREQKTHKKTEIV